MPQLPWPARELVYALAFPLLRSRPASAKSVAVAEPQTARLFTIRLPTRVLSGQQGVQADSAQALLVWPGDKDEPPEGPNGFGVLRDGRLLVADPLAKRVVVFDAKGGFVRAIAAGFAVDSIRVDAEDAVSVREATTGIDRPLAGFAVAPRGADATAAARVLLVSDTAATLTWAANGDRPARVLRVAASEAGSTLLSVECLAVEGDLTTYVALEATSRERTADTISLRKEVRKYSARGELVCQIADLPLGYFVMPVDELRVRDGSVYQLMTTAEGVQINIWRTMGAS